MPRNSTQASIAALNRANREVSKEIERIVAGGVESSDYVRGMRNAARILMQQKKRIREVGLVAVLRVAAGADHA